MNNFFIKTLHKCTHKCNLWNQFLFMGSFRFFKNSDRYWFWRTMSNALGYWVINAWLEDLGMSLWGFEWSASFTVSQLFKKLLDWDCWSTDNLTTGPPPNIYFSVAVSRQGFCWSLVKPSRWRCELTPHSQRAHIEYLTVGSFWGHSASSHKMSSHCEHAVSFLCVCNSHRELAATTAWWAHQDDLTNSSQQAEGVSHLVSSLWANWVSSKWAYCAIIQMSSLWEWC